jgi:adenylyltransferase/sulfurtransferase
MAVPEMSVEELKRRMDAQDDLQVVDVREVNEYQICNIGAKLIPLGELPQRLSELDPEKETVVHCRSGKRSMMAAMLMQEMGFKKIHNLAGGILAWADKIDPSMPKY